MTEVMAIINFVIFERGETNAHYLRWTQVAHNNSSQRKAHFSFGYIDGKIAFEHVFWHEGGI